MHLDDHIVTQFAQVVDRACGRMVDSGFSTEAMYHLADELACMLSNDTFERTPRVRYARELYHVMVAIKCHLRGESPAEENRAAFERLALLAANVPASVS